MTEEKIREFSLRISQTSRTGLVAITDEIIITYIKDAKKALGENDKEAFLFNIGKAKQFVDDLSSSLDMRFEISYELQRLYSFIRGRLIIAEGRENAEYLDHRGFSGQLSDQLGTDPAVWRDRQSERNALAWHFNDRDLWLLLHV